MKHPSHTERASRIGTVLVMLIVLASCLGQRVDAAPQAIAEAKSADAPKPAPKAEWCHLAPDHDCVTPACASGKRVIILFSAEWCGWCKFLAEKILPDSEVQKLLSNFALIEVDSDKNKDFVEKIGVSSYPTWLILEKGCETGIDSFSGTPRTPEAFIERFKSYLAH